MDGRVEKDWLSAGAVADILGLSRSAVHKRAARAGDELEAEGLLRRIPADGDGGADRLALHVDVVRRWAGDDSEAGDDGEAGDDSAAGGAPGRTVLWLAKEEIEVLQAELAALRIENQHLMQTMIESAQRERDEALAAASRDRAAFAATLKSLADVFSDAVD